MGSSASFQLPNRARFEAGVYGPTASGWRSFDSIVEAVVWISETVDKAPRDDYAMGAVRDPRGVLVAACDNRGRTWTEVDGPAAQVSEWSADPYPSRSHIDRVAAR